MRVEIVLSGYGGQGLLLAGGILGEAAAIYEGLNATNNQTYGVQARGGESRSEIIVSDEDINYAEIEHPDILLAMSQSAFNKFAPAAKEDAIIIVDTTFVEDFSCVKQPEKLKKYAITSTAQEVAGRNILANIVALGIIAKLTGVVSEESLLKAVLKKAPKDSEEANRKALRGGVLLAD